MYGSSVRAPSAPPVTHEARTVGAVDEHGGDDRHVVLRLDLLPVLVLVRQQLWVFWGWGGGVIGVVGEIRTGRGGTKGGARALRSPFTLTPGKSITLSWKEIAPAPAHAYLVVLTTPDNQVIKQPHPFISNYYIH